jgi:hypothetical protein
LSKVVAKLASITFSRLSLLSSSINLGFLTEGKSCCYIHHTFLFRFPTGWPSNSISDNLGWLAGGTMVRLLWWRFHLHGKVNPRSNNQCHSYSAP